MTTTSNNSSTGAISYDRAVEVLGTFVDINLNMPNRRLSTYANGRWTMRNIHGFLGFVSNAGKVWGTPAMMRA